MEFNCIEETIIKKAISDSGWIVNSVKDNMEYFCSNSYFPELVIIKNCQNKHLDFDSPIKACCRIVFFIT